MEEPTEETGPPSGSVGILSLWGPLGRGGCQSSAALRAAKACGCQGRNVFLRFLQLDGNMSQPFQFTPQFDPILGADRLDESFVRRAPGGQAARERALSLGRNRQETLPHRRAIRNGDESLF